MDHEPAEAVADEMHLGGAQLRDEDGETLA